MSSLKPNRSNLSASEREDSIYQVLLRVNASLQIAMDRSSIDLGDISHADPEATNRQLLVSGAQKVGVAIRELQLGSVQDIVNLVGEGFPVVIASPDGSFHVLEKVIGSKIEASEIRESATPCVLSARQLRSLIDRDSATRIFVAKKELECDSMSASNSSALGHGHHHDHPSPLRRFLSLLRLDLKDIWTLVLFALVAGILSLATPLAVESLVNVVSWGTYLQPLLVIAIMLMSFLGLSGILRVLQVVVVEMIQRRQFVRIVGDLAHRFPRAQLESLDGVYPREYANRVFDIMTIQKTTAVLLLDGVSIALTTIVGLLLLAFYHPFLLGFDIVLVISMISITWILGRGGIRTAIDESIVKYEVAHWLQDVIDSPAIFKVNGGEGFAIDRANQLASKYLDARNAQFRVVLRQVVFAIGLQVVALTAVLGLGGWLVISQQLTLGQLVASELVVTVVVGAFAKAGKSLEKFYDLMAAIDKVGHLLDIPVDPRHELGSIPDGPLPIRWDDLVFSGSTDRSEVPAATIPPGSRVAIVGDDYSGKSKLARTLAGLHSPQKGLAEVGDFEASHAAISGKGKVVAYAGGHEIFHGTIIDNVDLGRSGIGQNRIREVLQQVGLWDDVLRMPDGQQTVLQTAGKPLTRPQISQLLLARAMTASPNLLVVDGLLDELNDAKRDLAWQTIGAENAPWTLVLVTSHQELADRCDIQISVRG